MKRDYRNKSKAKCGITGKARFGSHDSAFLRACELFESGRMRMNLVRAYLCHFCGGWHMTSKP